MGEVMRKAIQVDDDQFFKVQEKLAQLEVRTDQIAKYRPSFGSLQTYSGLPVFVCIKDLNQPKILGWECRT